MMGMPHSYSMMTVYDGLLVPIVRGMLQERIRHFGVDPTFACRLF